MVREHKYQPIRGDVCVIGRQTLHATRDEMVTLLKKYDIRVNEADIEIDDYTQASRRAGSVWVSDRSFFRILGVGRFSSLDVSTYEGAEIVHDLNKPIGHELANRFDFLVDGSTFDNVFSPSVALMNFGRMLKPGGRLVSLNALSNDNGPYLILTPFWLLDYFVANRFSDCKLYVGVHEGNGERAVFTPDLSQLEPRGLVWYDNFRSGYPMDVLVVAE